MALKHTLVISADNKTLHLEEKGAGGLDTNRDYVIGADFTEGTVMGKTYLERVTWQGGALVLLRRHIKGDFELELTRFLDKSTGGDGEVVLRLQSVHRNLNTNIETESTSIFKKKKKE